MELSLQIINKYLVLLGKAEIKEIKEIDGFEVDRKKFDDEKIGEMVAENLEEINKKYRFV